VAQTRREFLYAMGAAALAGPKLRFPTAARERIAVASYPFRAFIDAPGNPDRDASQTAIPLKDFAAMVADKFNIRAIEPLAGHFASIEPGYLNELHAAVDRARSRIVNIPVDLEASFYDPDAQRRASAIAESKKWVDVAVSLGSPSVRLHIARVKDVEPDDVRTIDSLKQVLAYAEPKKIVVNLENDDIESENAFFLVRVIQGVASPFLHGLPDFANSMAAGDESYNYRAVNGMFRAAYNIAHVKDGEKFDGKFVSVDLAKTFGIAKASDYRGFFSMEFEGEGSPYEGTQKLIDQTLKYI
jgi:sugar phosphate isomerase/epimerase